MQNPAESTRLTLQQKLNISLLIAHLCSLTVVVLLRHKVGVRHLSGGLFVVTISLLLLGCPWLDDTYDNENATERPFRYQTFLPSDKPVRPGCLGLFAFAVLLTAARQKNKRWRDFKNGGVWHSYHRGISVLSFLPYEHRTITRFVEPALCLVVGFICWHWLSVALGAWLIFAGMGLRLVEQTLYKQELARTFDTIDGLVESDAQGEIVEHYSAAVRNPPPGQSEAIPTGYAPDVQEAIRRRSAKNSQRM